MFVKKFHVLLLLVLLSVKTLFALDAPFTIIEFANKQGLSDKKGNIIIPAEHEKLGWSTGETKVVNGVIGYRKNGSWGLVNLKNQRVANPLYHYLEPINDQLVIAARNIPVINRIKYGVIDTKGKTIIEFEYFKLQKNTDRLIASIDVQNNIKYGIIALNGELKLPLVFNHIVAVSENVYAASDPHGKTGLYDKKGRILMPHVLDSITVFNNHLSFAWKEGKRGLVDHKGKVLVNPDYHYIRLTGGKTTETLKYPEWCVYTQENKLEKKLEYDEVTPAGKNLYKVRIGDNEALINENNELLTEFKPFAIGQVENGRAVFKFKGKYGVFNQSGKTLLDPEYDSIILKPHVYQVLMHHMGKTGWHLLDIHGKQITRQSYDIISESGHIEMYRVKKDSYWGLLSQSGKELVFCKYDSIECMVDGRMKVHFFGEQGILNEKGDWDVLPQKLEIDMLSGDRYVQRSEYGSSLTTFSNQKIFSTDAWLFPHGEMFLEKARDGKYGLFDKQGKRILPSIYDEISPLYEDSIYYVKSNHKYSFVSKNGKVLNTLDGRFREIFPMTEQFIGVRIDDKYGFVDVNGKLRIANRYEGIGKFENGYAPVKILGKWGYVDKREVLQVQPKYDTVFGFNEKLCVVVQNGKYGIINKKGDLIVRPEFDEIRSLPQGGYLSVQDGRKGLIDADGRHVLMPRFDELTDLNNGFIFVSRKGKYGLNATNGLSIIPMMYDKIIYDDYNNRYLTMKMPEWQLLQLDN
jgi:hypothetical protein